MAVRTFFLASTFPRNVLGIRLIPEPTFPTAGTFPCYSSPMNKAGAEPTASPIALGSARSLGVGECGSEASRHSFRRNSPFRWPVALPGHFDSGLNKAVKRLRDSVW